MNLCARVTWLCVTAVIATGCRSTELVGNNCELAPGVPCDDISAGGSSGSGGDANDSLDLLFVVDNTPGMASTQAALVEALPEMMRTLVTGDVGADNRMEFAPVRDIHFAVVSTDMGLPGVDGVSDCGNDTGRPLGDDGVFLSTSSNLVVLGKPCSDPPSLVEYSAFDPLHSMNTLLQDSACLMPLGDLGCRHAMPLEAALKALWNMQGTDVTFFNGIGHGIATQPGFLRPNALLAIIVVTQRDDCSSLDFEHLLADDDLAPGDPRRDFARDARCVMLADAHLHQVPRYKDGFGALKGGALDRVFLGVIAGVPSDLASLLSTAVTDSALAVAYEDVVYDARMLVELDDASPVDARTLRRSCGNAVPPRRLIDLAQLMGTQAAVASICDDMSVSLFTMTRALARRLDPTTTL